MKTETSTQAKIIASYERHLAATGDVTRAAYNVGQDIKADAARLGWDEHLTATAYLTSMDWIVSHINGDAR